jgi:hypothetical protein
MFFCANACLSQSVTTSKEHLFVTVCDEVKRTAVCHGLRRGQKNICLSRFVGGTGGRRVDPNFYPFILQHSF